VAPDFPRLLQTSLDFPRLLILLLWLTVAATGQSISDSTNYSRRVWQSSDGLPEDFAQALARTRDGYLWIGTSGGLVRFDGVRFTVFNHENQPAFQDDSFYALYVTQDGALWGGTEGGGLVRYQNGVFKVFGVAEGLSNGFVRVIFEDRQRRLWVGTDQGLFRWEQERLRRVDNTPSIPRMGVHAITEDRAGRLLVGGGGLLVLQGEQASHYTSTEAQADNSIRTLRQTADGALWVGTISGLRRLPEGLNGNPFNTPRLISQTNVSYLLESRRGQLWIGTYGQGLLCYHNGQIEKFAAPAVLPHNNVLALFDDGEDDIWVGTQGGLLRLSPSAASTITTADGVPQSINTIYQDARGPLYVAALNGRLFQVEGQTLMPAPLPASVRSLPVRNVFRDSAGTLWLGTDGQGMVKLTERGAQRYSKQQGLVSDFVRAFCEDRAGQLWIGTDGGLSRFDGLRFQNFNTDAGLAYGSIRALWQDRSGALWIGTDGGLSCWQAGQFVKDALLERLRGQKIWALHEDPSGGLWIGTQGTGLFWRKDGKLTQFTTEHGLPSNKIHFIVEDAQGMLWMSGPTGIVAVARRALEESRARPIQALKLAVRVYSTSEGLSTNQMNGGVQSAGTLALDGKLWFPSTKGAVRIEPTLPQAGSAWPVVLEQVLADDREIPFTTSLKIAPGKGKLEIHYTALRLRAPESLRFKYRLENFDNEWTEAGTRRIAYFTNVPAGKYRFHVVAYESNEPRHATAQILPLEWQPHFYQTSWFFLLCALAAGSAAWGAYQLHLRNLRQRFEAVLAERNRLARDMHDTLIQGCVGVSALLEAASSAQEISPALGHQLLDRARHEVRAAVDEARLAVWNLRESAGSGQDLVEATAQLVQRIERETGVPAKFSSAGTPEALSAANEWSLLMVIREALHNAVRHGAPTQLDVAMQFDQRTLQIEIRDDGQGFDPATLASSNGRHYGLIGMRERVERLGGVFALVSQPGQGTQVAVRIPVDRLAPLKE
jgi:ligand-binding sensor domain-containing protein/signal transduction histidine kinase